MFLKISNSHVKPWSIFLSLAVSAVILAGCTLPISAPPTATSTPLPPLPTPTLTPITPTPMSSHPGSPPYRHSQSHPRCD